MSRRVLLVEDDREMCAVLEARLTRRGYQVTWRLSAEEALAALEEQDFDAVVTDVRMKGLDGLALCERVIENRPDVPVVIITAFGSMETAIAAIRSGAYDFLTKPFEIEALDLTLQRALQHRSLREEVRRLRSAVAAQAPPHVALGTSPAMEALRKTVAQVAPSAAPVLIWGETGTGKELVARAIHAASERRSGPFVAVNCAAMPATLLESELFGHARGAFTDATARRRGLFQEAHGGTLFLDEVGELALDLQPKLLRAVEEGQVRPVGQDRPVSVDVRILAATQRDLEGAVDEGRFRQDLLFRLDVLRVQVPPLRSRGGDVLLLAQHFLERAAGKLGKEVGGLSSAAAERLTSYGWPGNVRELENSIERAVALTVTDRIVVDDLPQRIRQARADDVLVASRDPAELVPLEEVERRYILRVIEAAGGNKTLAARILGLDRTTLYRKLERYERP